MGPMEASYKSEKTFEERIKNASKYLAKYPDKVPIILYSMEQEQKEKLIKQEKYLISGKHNIFVLVKQILTKSCLPADQTLYLYVKHGEVMLQNQDQIDTVYNKYKDKDKFLYISYSTIPTLG